MSGLSSALRVTDLDDFIAPSQACVKPVEIPKGEEGGALRRGADGTVVEVKADGTEKKLEKATINLNDCLACSGCVTSAEAVLVSSQSNDEFLKVLEQEGTEIVVSVSPQSMASLGRKYGMTGMSVFKKLTAFFKSIGVKAVFDTVVARNLCLLAEARTFVAALKGRSGEPLPQHNHAFDSTLFQKSAVPSLPMLNSACPGWVCYAEKTHGSDVLPYMSPVKSPQQVTGSVVKELLYAGKSIYHVTVMPCYDKKLEASRDDFYHDVLGSREVDCVLSTAEIVDLISAKSALSLSDFEEVEIDTTLADAFNGVVKEDERRVFASFSSVPSGGFADFVYMYTAKVVFGEEVDRKDMAYAYPRRKNNDMKELVLKVGEDVKLRVALAYGFRNIQTIVSKLKNKRCDYDYVEVMACPSACSNGGGQIRPEEGEDVKGMLKEVEAVYAEMFNDNVISMKDADKYDFALFSTPDQLRRGVFTQYHAREKLSNPLMEKW
mmetsp:Transcript_4896/g.10392  ORF Transcript_4896/g.10392 Transcript_4896/m.10392 type:complete len:492 (+) Transcript_4896:137-1612(+)